MSQLGVKWEGRKIWINFAKIFVQSLAQARTAQTILLVDQ